MAEKEFYVEEEDGVVIYDESDDYDPDEPVETEGDFHLPDNEEIFTDEYMQDFARKMDAKIAKEKRIQLLVSVCVILGIILYVLFLIWLFAL